MRYRSSSLSCLSTTKVQASSAAHQTSVSTTADRNLNTVKRASISQVLKIVRRPARVHNARTLCKKHIHLNLLPALLKLQESPQANSRLSVSIWARWHTIGDRPIHRQLLIPKRSWISTWISRNVSSKSPIILSSAIKNWVSLSIKVSQVITYTRSTLHKARMRSLIGNFLSMLNISPTLSASSLLNWLAIGLTQGTILVMI